MRQHDDLGFLAFWQFLAAGYALMLACVPAVIVYVTQNLSYQGAASAASDLPGGLENRFRAHLAWIPITLGLALAILFVIAGLSMLRHQNLKLVWLAASLQLLFFPVGTVAGILALRALTRTELEKVISQESTRVP